MFVVIGGRRIRSNEAGANSRLQSSGPCVKHGLRIGRLRSSSGGGFFILKSWASYPPHLPHLCHRSKVLQSFGGHNKVRSENKCALFLEIIISQTELSANKVTLIVASWESPTPNLKFHNPWDPCKDEKHMKRIFCGRIGETELEQNTSRKIC